MLSTSPRLRTVSVPPGFPLTGPPVAYPPFDFAPPPQPARASAATSPTALRRLILVQGFPGQLLASPVEQGDVEVVGAVVVGGDQGEALLAQRALVHGQPGQLGRHDRPSA